MRIDKFLTECGVASRSDAKKMIKQGRITVNGLRVTDPGQNVSEADDDIIADGKKITYEKFVYFMLNKPAGIVSATTDGHDATVIDLFKDENRKNLFPVGRLDKDTVGLLIITDDGELGHRLTSPKTHAVKEYYVRLERPVDEQAVKQLETGIDLGEDGITKPAVVNKISDTEIILSIFEGKFHQVKRMLKAVGNEVIYLKRLSVGGVKLDEALKEGEYRRLLPSEISLLKKI